MSSYPQDNDEGAYLAGDAYAETQQEGDYLRDRAENDAQVSHPSPRLSGPILISPYSHVTAARVPEC